MDNKRFIFYAEFENLSSLFIVQRSVFCLCLLRKSDNKVLVVDGMYEASCLIPYIFGFS